MGQFEVFNIFYCPLNPTDREKLIDGYLWYFNVIGWQKVSHN